MMRISIDLVSAISKERDRSLGTMDIELIGVTPDQQVGKYRYTIYQWGEKKRVWKTGEVQGFNRKLRGGWDLLYRILHHAVHTRNRDV
jgi:hypothetical protein